MIGDKLVIEPYHTQRATEICAVLTPQLSEKFTVAVAGESGSGKSETAFEIARLFNEQGIQTGILQQDDYFVFPPKTNHLMRQRNLQQVGFYEVKLDFLDSNLRSFKRAENPIYKPLVIYDEDRIASEEIDTGNLQVLIAEGTYTSLLTFADFKVFIDRDFNDTLAARKRRGRDQFDPFIQDVLEREHELISPHKKLANLFITKDFGAIELQAP